MKQPMNLDTVPTPTAVAELQAAAENQSILRRWVDKRELNGDFKSALKKILETTVVAARTVVELVAWIISGIEHILEKYPTRLIAAAIGRLGEVARNHVGGAARR